MTNIISWGTRFLLNAYHTAIHLNKSKAFLKPMKSKYRGERFREIFSIIMRLCVSGNLLNFIVIVDFSLYSVLNCSLYDGCQNLAYYLPMMPLFPVVGSLSYFHTELNGVGVLAVEVRL